MIKKWHPVIDYTKCNKCGYCIDLCAYNVYEKTKSPNPVVTYPENCIKDCKYCSVMCAQNAIKYIEGDIVYICDSDHFCVCCG